MIADYIDSLKTNNTNNFKLQALPSLPGVSSSKPSSFEKPKMSVLSPPMIENSKMRDITYSNGSKGPMQVISMEELSALLGGKRVLPIVDTLVETEDLESVKPKSSSPKDKKDKETTGAQRKKYCKTLNKEMITGSRPAKGKKVYTLDEMKEIARTLGLSPTGTKDVLATTILDKMQELGC